MTEQEWLSSENPISMLFHLLPHRKKRTNRKLRLFACAWCRHSADHHDLAFREAVEMAEQFADGMARRESLIGAWERMATTRIKAAAANPDAWRAAYEAIRRITEGPVADEKQAKEKRLLLLLLRDVFGNPFKPYPAPPSWPSTVIGLAESLYDGHDCRLPLSDALEESGHGELAEHFRAESWHPKGCYAMDLILGKT
jgi:hypothetical protein